MKVHWHNLIAAGLGLLVLVLTLRYREPVMAFLSTAKRIGPGNSPEDVTLGLIVLGICAATLVAIVRILTSNKQ